MKVTVIVIFFAVNSIDIAYDRYWIKSYENNKKTEKPFLYCDKYIGIDRKNTSKLFVIYMSDSVVIQLLSILTIYSQPWMIAL